MRMSELTGTITIGNVKMPAIYTAVVDPADIEQLNETMRKVSESLCFAWKGRFGYVNREWFADRVAELKEQERHDRQVRKLAKRLIRKSQYRVRGRKRRINER